MPFSVSLFAGGYGAAFDKWLRDKWLSSVHGENETPQIKAASVRVGTLEDLGFWLVLRKE
jgi:hypothetical protein